MARVPRAKWRQIVLQNEEVQCKSCWSLFALRCMQTIGTNVSYRVDPEKFLQDLSLTWKVFWEVASHCKRNDLFVNNKKCYCWTWHGPRQCHPCRRAFALNKNLRSVWAFYIAKDVTYTLLMLYIITCFKLEDCEKCKCKKWLE